MPNEVRQIMVAAHRGNSVLCPENTMAAFRSAVAMDVDQIELDLHMTRDGSIIVMHDGKVDRTTDGTGLVRDFRFDEIRRLDAGCRKDGRFRGEKVPAFEEFLELMKDHPRLTANVELKDYPEDDTEWAFLSAGKALDLLEKYGMTDRIWINSWSAVLLRWVDRRYGRHVIRLHGYYPLSCYKPGWTGDPMEILHSCCLWCRDRILPQEDFDFVRSRSVEPWIFAYRDTDEFYGEAVSRGIAAITTNDPAGCMEWMREHHFRS